MGWIDGLDCSEMSDSFEDWSVSSRLRPRPEDFPFDLDWAVSSTVALRAHVPADAFTAQTPPALCAWATA